MNLDRLRREQQRNAKRTQILERAQARQRAMEDAFWSRSFPLIAKGVVDALNGRGIAASWAVLDSWGLDERHALSVENIGQVMYVDRFRYSVNYDKSGRLHLHYSNSSAHPGRSPFEDSVPVEPPVVSLRVNVADGSLAPFNIGGIPPDTKKGAYRFRWYAERDTERVVARLLEVLDGRRPRSDYYFSGCFIATAVFGQDAVQLEILRDFRDQYFAATRSGKLILYWYYSRSPQIAEVILRRPVVLALCRFVLAHLACIIDKMSFKDSRKSAHDSWKY